MTTNNAFALVLFALAATFSCFPPSATGQLTAASVGVVMSNDNNYAWVTPPVGGWPYDIPGNSPNYMLVCPPGFAVQALCASGMNENCYVGGQSYYTLLKCIRMPGLLNTSTQFGAGPGSVQTIASGGGNAEIHQCPTGSVMVGLCSGGSTPICGPSHDAHSGALCQPLNDPSGLYPNHESWPAPGSPNYAACNTGQCYLGTNGLTSNCDSGDSTCWQFTAGPSTGIVECTAGQVATGICTVGEAAGGDCTSAGLSVPSDSYGFLQCPSYPAMQCPQPFVYGQWSSWSQTCGTRTRTRTQSCSEFCSNVLGQPCTQEGPTVQTNTLAPVNFTYSAWGPWNASCGPAVRTRNETCSTAPTCVCQNSQPTTDQTTYDCTDKYIVNVTATARIGYTLAQLNDMANAVSQLNASLSQAVADEFAVTIGDNETVNAVRAGIATMLTQLQAGLHTLPPNIAVVNSALKWNAATGGSMSELNNLVQQLEQYDNLLNYVSLESTLTAELNAVAVGIEQTLTQYATVLSDELQSQKDTLGDVLDNQATLLAGIQAVYALDGKIYGQVTRNGQMINANSYAIAVNTAKLNQIQNTLNAMMKSSSSSGGLSGFLSEIPGLDAIVDGITSLADGDSIGDALENSAETYVDDTALNLAGVLGDVTGDADILGQVTADTELDPTEGESEAMDAEITDIEDVAVLAGRHRVRRSSNSTHLFGLGNLSKAITAFRRSFVRNATGCAQVSRGWDTNSNGLAEPVEVAALVGDIIDPGFPNAPEVPAVLAQALDNTSASSPPRWSTLLAREIDPPGSVRVADFVASALQMPSQPLRARIDSAISFWNALLVLFKPMVYLLNGDGSNSSCYGVSEQAAVHNADACDASAAACPPASGWGLWPNTTGTTCNMDIYYFVYYLFGNSANTFKSYVVLAEAIEQANRDTLAWMCTTMDNSNSSTSFAGSGRSPSGWGSGSGSAPGGLQCGFNVTCNVTLGPDMSPMQQRLADAVQLVEMMNRTKSYFSSRGFHGALPAPQASSTGPLWNTTLEQRYAFTTFNNSLLLGNLQSLLQVATATFATAYNRGLQVQFNEAFLSTQAFVNTGTVPSCLTTAGASCSAGSGQSAAIAAIQRVRDGTAISAVRLLRQAVNALLYATLNIASNNPSYDLLSQVDVGLTVGSFENAQSAALDAWSNAESSLGFQGNEAMLMFCVQRATSPDVFSLLEQTGIASIRVQWPVNPAMRELRVLNFDVQAFILPTPLNTVVSSTVRKGNFSVFFNTDANEPIIVLHPALSEAQVQFRYQYNGDTCDAVTQACTDSSCNSASFMQVAPYGDWMVDLQVQNAASGAALPNTVFKGVDEIRLVWNVRYYMPDGSPGESPFPNSVCQAGSALSTSQLANVCVAPASSTAMSSSSSTKPGGVPATSAMPEIPSTPLAVGPKGGNANGSSAVTTTVTAAVVAVAVVLVVIALAVVALWQFKKKIQAEARDNAYRMLNSEADISVPTGAVYEDDTETV